MIFYFMEILFGQHIAERSTWIHKKRCWYRCDTGVIFSNCMHMCATWCWYFVWIGCIPSSGFRQLRQLCFHDLWTLRDVRSYTSASWVTFVVAIKFLNQANICACHINARLGSFVELQPGHMCGSKYSNVQSSCYMLLYTCTWPCVRK